MHIYNIEWWKLQQTSGLTSLSACVCVCVCQAHSMQHSVFPVKTEWTQSNLPLLVCEMSFSTHRNGWKERRYQNLLNILQVYIPLPHSKKSPMVWKCMCMSERESQVWQLPQWVSQDFTSWVFNCESWPFHANCTSTHTHTHWTRVEKTKKDREMLLFHPATPNTELGTECSIQLRHIPKPVPGSLESGGWFHLTSSVS